MLSQLPDEATITSSVATRHYGVSAMTEWEESRDRGQEKDWSETDGKYKVAKVSHFPHSINSVLASLTARNRR